MDTKPLTCSPADGELMRYRVSGADVGGTLVAGGWGTRVSVDTGKSVAVSDGG